MNTGEEEKEQKAKKEEDKNPQDTPHPQLKIEDIKLVLIEFLA